MAYRLVGNSNWTGFENSSREFQPQLLNADHRRVLSTVAERIHEGARPANFSESDIALIREAEDTLSKYDPSTFTHLKSWISGYCKLSNTPFRSSSLPHAFGCIFWGDKLWESTPKAVAVSLVHEMAHQELFLVNLVDRLVLSEADFKLVHAPFQGRLRPTIGRFHSLYALFRMVEFERVIGIESERHVEQLLATARTFAANDLTEFGMNLVNVVVERASSTIKFKDAISL